MNPKDVSNLWLASGGTYLVLGIAWIASALYFASVAKKIGRDRRSGNDGCLLTVCTTIFAILGGSIGLMVSVFPWYIFTSIIGSIIAPAIACKIFLRGKLKY